jgi:hypothetical protein
LPEVFAFPMLLQYETDSGRSKRGRHGR